MNRTEDNTPATINTMIKKIISGGQMGADRAALDVALKLNIPHGGWCPRGRLAEDGIIEANYQLTETPSADPSQRTEWNVRDSDGTVIFSISPNLSGGSAKTEVFAQQYQKPRLHISKEKDAERSRDMLIDFLTQHEIEVLNVAGPRHSEEPAVAQFVSETLFQTLRTKPL